MSADETAALFQQHAILLQDIENVYVVLAICAFLGLVFLFTMIVAAAWSVRTVNKRQLQLEGKFNVLIDALLQHVQTDIDARGIGTNG